MLIAHPGLGLSTRPPLFTSSIPRRHEVRALRKVLAEVLRDEAALNKNRLFLLAWEVDGNCGRLAEGMDLFEFGRSESGFLVAVEENSFVVQIEFFEEPYNALGTRLVEPVFDVRVCPAERIGGGTYQNSVIFGFSAVDAILATTQTGAPTPLT